MEEEYEESNEFVKIKSLKSEIIHEHFSYAIDKMATPQLRYRLHSNSRLLIIEKYLLCSGLNPH